MIRLNLLGGGSNKLFPSIGREMQVPVLEMPLIMSSEVSICMGSTKSLIVAEEKVGTQSHLIISRVSTGGTLPAVFSSQQAIPEDLFQPLSPPLPTSIDTMSHNRVDKCINPALAQTSRQESTPFMRRSTGLFKKGLTIYH